MESITRSIEARFACILSAKRCAVAEREESPPQEFAQLFGGVQCYRWSSCFLIEKQRGPLAIINYRSPPFIIFP